MAALASAVTSWPWAPLRILTAVPPSYGNGPFTGRGLIYHSNTTAGLSLAAEWIPTLQCPRSRLTSSTSRAKDSTTDLGYRRGLIVHEWPCSWRPKFSLHDAAYAPRHQPRQPTGQQHTSPTLFFCCCPMRYSKIAQKARTALGIVQQRSQHCAHCDGLHGVASHRCSGCFVGFVVMPDSASVLSQPATTAGQQPNRPTGVRSADTQHRYLQTDTTYSRVDHVSGPGPCAGKPLTDGRLQEQLTGTRASQESELLVLNDADFASLPACQVSTSHNLVAMLFDSTGWRGSTCSPDHKASCSRWGL